MRRPGATLPCPRGGRRAAARRGGGARGEVVLPPCGSHTPLPQSQVIGCPRAGSVRRAYVLRQHPSPAPRHLQRSRPRWAPRLSAPGQRREAGAGGGAGRAEGGSPLLNRPRRWQRAPRQPAARGEAGRSWAARGLPAGRLTSLQTWSAQAGGTDGERETLGKGRHGQHVDISTEDRTGTISTSCLRPHSFGLNLDCEPMSKDHFRFRIPQPRDCHFKKDAAAVG